MSIEIEGIKNKWKEHIQYIKCALEFRRLSSQWPPRSSTILQIDQCWFHSVGPRFDPGHRREKPKRFMLDHVYRMLIATSQTRRYAF